MDRQVGGGTLRVEAVARDRGGNLRTSLGVSRGIPWIYPVWGLVGESRYPRERARRKVEIDVREL